MVGTKKAAPQREPQTQTNDTATSAAMSMLLAATRRKPVSRVRLQLILDLEDRAAREWIAQQRRKGYPICSSAGAYGYWMASDEEELETFLREYLAHAKEQQKTARMMRKAFQG